MSRSRSRLGLGPQRLVYIPDDCISLHETSDLNVALNSRHFPPGPRLHSQPQSITAFWSVLKITLIGYRGTRVLTTCPEFLNGRESNHMPLVC